MQDMTSWFRFKRKSSLGESPAKAATIKVILTVRKLKSLLVFKNYVSNHSNV